MNIEKNTCHNVTMSHKYKGFFFENKALYRFFCDNYFVTLCHKSLFVTNNVTILSQDVTGMSQFCHMGGVVNQSKCGKRKVKKEGGCGK